MIISQREKLCFLKALFFLRFSVERGHFGNRREKKKIPFYSNIGRGDARKERVEEEFISVHGASLGGLEILRVKSSKKGRDLISNHKNHSSEKKKKEKVVKYRLDRFPPKGGVTMFSNVFVGGPRVRHPY